MKAKNPDIELMDVVNQEYLQEYEKYNSLHITNLINQDTVTIQISVGLLAALTTLGKDILLVDKVVSVLFLSFMTITIVQIIAGYFISNRFFVFVKKKLTDNHIGRKNLYEGLRSSPWGKVNDVINVTQYATFVIGITLFLILLFMYVGGLKND